MRVELTPAADGKRLNTITIFNKAYLNQYKKMGGRRVLPGHEFPESGYFQWATEVDLILPSCYKGKLPPMYEELFGGDLCYQIGPTDPADTDAIIKGTPDCEYGTAIQKAE